MLTALLLQLSIVAYLSLATTAENARKTSCKLSIGCMPLVNVTIDTLVASPRSLTTKSCGDFSQRITQNCCCCCQVDDVSKMAMAGWEEKFKTRHKHISHFICWQQQPQRRNDDRSPQKNIRRQTVVDLLLEVCKILQIHYDYIAISYMYYAYTNIILVYTMIFEMCEIN